MSKTVYVGYEWYQYEGCSIPLIVTDSFEAIKKWRGANIEYREFEKMEITTESSNEKD